MAEKIEPGEHEAAARLPRGRLALASSTSAVLLAACGGSTGPTAAQPTQAPKSAVAPTAPAPAAARSVHPPHRTHRQLSGTAPSSPVASASPGLSGVSLSILQWSSFVPDVDPFFKQQIEEGFECLPHPRGRADPIQRAIHVRSRSVGGRSSGVTPVDLKPNCKSCLYLSTVLQRPVGCERHAATWAWSAAGPARPGPVRTPR